ncbi:MAG: Protein phosphatase 2C 1 [Cyphobasidiales sp. Tagirdzhanova-0007]|nr:MAG: Protein phosphatase 2C 1 [Cyphobasidiales sp. Tagirdzhanova-0007]
MASIADQLQGTMHSPEQLHRPSSHTTSPSPTTASSSSSSTAASSSAASRPRPSGHNQRRSSSPNASSAPITLAPGSDTKGIVNQHPSEATDQGQPAAATVEKELAAQFRVGVSEDRNKKCRRTMEDSHAFVYDFGGVRGQGYFAVFDGHAGKHAAEWCGVNFHTYLLEQLRQSQASQPIPDLLNATFHVVDGELSKLAAQGGTHSGCTAVTAFLRLEDAHGNAVELDHSGAANQTGTTEARGGAAAAPSSTLADNPVEEDEGEEEQKRKFGDGLHRDRIKNFFGGKEGETTAESTPFAGSSTQQAQVAHRDPGRPVNLAKRTLYTANVGDARAVLCRGGKAVRLTYDHKGSDAQEAKRITDAGGFVMNNRVNGVLAVTRSLGDSSMKEFVVGSPYTTETTLGDDDQFLIIACDGLWDVCEDQMAVDLIRDLKDAQEASKILLDHALTNFSTDNLSVLVVALKPL